MQNRMQKTKRGEEIQRERVAYFWVADLQSTKRMNVNVEVVCMEVCRFLECMMKYASSTKTQIT